MRSEPNPVIMIALTSVKAEWLIAIPYSPRQTRERRAPYPGFISSSMVGISSETVGWIGTARCSFV